MISKSFDFATANRILFGAGSLETLPELIVDFGEHVLVVKGKQYPDPTRLYTLLETAGKSITEFIVADEPEDATIEEAAKTGKENNCAFVIGFGGGAPIDAGKAVSALLNNDGNLMDYLEVVGKGRPLEKPGLPFIAIPTTAGTGSEVTRNAVISIPDRKVKVSMRNAIPPANSSDRLTLN